MSRAKRCAKKHAKARHRRVSVPADTTVYTFNVNTMPKGRWRWRVHSLNDTGFLGEMSEWRLFTSQ